jgi:predicted Zn finger-like uncharacterized protein
MRWNCPHCGVALAVNDDKLQANWTFSRCYKCHGFAMIKKPEVSLIKLERGPAHTPERSIGDQKVDLRLNSPPLVPQHPSALQTMAKAIQNQQMPVVKTSRRHLHQAPTASVSPPSPPKLNNKSLTTKFGTIPAQHIPNGPVNALGLPEPLPEEPHRPWYYRFLPFAMGIAAFLAAGSGVYAYLQGRSVIRSSQTPITPTKNTEAPQKVPTQKPAAVSQTQPQTDTVLVSAMAPSREAPLLPQKIADKLSEQKTFESLEFKTPLLIRPLHEHTRVYSQPDITSEVLTLAQPKLHYVVEQVKKDWLQILFYDSNSKSERAFIRRTEVAFITGSDPKIDDETSQPQALAN